MNNIYKKTNLILKKNNFKLKKSLGQNFLKSNFVLNNIIKFSNLSKEDNVIEIGPGIGSLTEKLAQKANKVLAIEIDSFLIPILKDNLSSYSNVYIVNNDILKIDLEELVLKFLDNNHNLKVVANLPYYITTPIMFLLLKSKLKIDCVLVMVQKEVAERLAASPGSKKYGSLTVSINTISNVQILSVVDAKNFIPSPKVDSSLIKITLKKQPLISRNEQNDFSNFIKKCFAKRRKNLLNNLKCISNFDVQLLKNILISNNINLCARPEEISIESFVKIYHDLFKYK